MTIGVGMLFAFALMTNWLPALREVFTGYSTSLVLLVSAYLGGNVTHRLVNGKLEIASTQSSLTQADGDGTVVDIDSEDNNLTRQP